MSTVVQDFLTKKAARRQVKSHIRGGKVVSTYDRDQDQPKKKETGKARAAEDLRLWKIWKEGGQKPEDLKPILSRFDGFIGQQAAVWKGKVNIPPSVIDIEFKRWFLEALKRYDPSIKGFGGQSAQIKTFATPYLMKAMRYMTSHQNMARIPETRIYEIRKFQDAELSLDEKLGRPPTHDELAKELGWKPKQVATLATEIRRDLVTSQFEYDPALTEPSREEEIKRLIVYELTPEELQVYRYTFGVGGVKEMTPGQIAKKLKMNPSKVSRIRKKLTVKVNKYMQ
jgi:DNA-directed RNA polymerase specialized sigma subunit